MLRDFEHEVPSRSPSAGLETRRALKIDGSEPSRNSTSTTLPRTWLMRPVAMLSHSYAIFLVNSCIASRAGCRPSRPRRRRRYPSARVVIMAWRARFISSVSRCDHLGGVVGRAIHRGHLRALLAGLGLEQRMKNRIFEVAAQYHRHQFGPAGLDQVVDRSGDLAGCPPRASLRSSAAAARRSAAARARSGNRYR